MADDPHKLIARWQAGDQQAAAELFGRYANRLIALARSRLSARLAHRVDPEDVVQSVCRSFFADAREGRYAIERGGDLWQLLVTMTLHKVQDQGKRHARAKRDIGRETNFGSEDSLVGLHANLRTREPSPLEAVELTEQVEQIMRGLKPNYRRILELRLQGYNIDEIAAETQTGERTVRRVLDQVKQQVQQGQTSQGQ
jgi:RNA polymerase sigma factor (sigma-70 family)